MPSDDTAEFIRDCVTRRRLHWTYHVGMRMRGRFISRRDIIDSAATFEIIESYPEDKYLPSYLVYAVNGGNTFHILFAVDRVEGNVRVVTAYRPDSGEWENDMKSRRISQ